MNRSLISPRPVRALPALLLGLALAVSPARADKPAKAPGDPYLLDTDPVSGQALPAVAGQVFLVHEGREFRFATAENMKAFQAAPDKYIKAVDRKMAEAQKAFYPLETCVVSGEKLGGMGEPVEIIHRNRLVRFCCGNCTGEFRKNPAVFLEKIDRAVVERQKAAYPVKVCVVSGEPLGSMGEPFDLVVGNRLARLCCQGCEEKFRKDPRGYFATLLEKATKK